MRSPVVLGVLALLGGCDPCAGDGAAAVRLGTGADAFEPVQDGQVLDVAFGAQGGQHVWGAAELEGLALGGLGGPSGAPASAPQFTLSLGDDEGPVATWGPGGVAMGGQEVVAGLTVVLNVNVWSTPWLYPDGWDPDEADGDEQTAVEQAVADDVESRDLRFAISVVDRCDRSAADARTVRIRGVSTGW